MKSRQEVEKYLESFIPQKHNQKFPAAHGLKRAAYLLKLLDNPQEKYPIIHVAGTSGKGTTAHITSQILTSHNKKVGLHLSPHLQDIRERMMINNHLISNKQFLYHFQKVLKAVKKCQKEFDRPTYFEILTSLAFYTFARSKVDVAIIETGMGGTFDATNTIKRADKICTITRIGLDHTNILGTTIKEIAAQKAGIIQKNNTAITLSSPSTKEIFQKRAVEKSAKTVFLSKDNLKNIQVSKSGTTFDYHFKNTHLPKLHLSLPGKHQAENATLALTSSISFLKKLDDKKVRKTLSNIHIKGRLDLIKKEGKTIVLDGAHNPQKIKALTSTLTQIYPARKFTIILAVKKGKDLNKILKTLKPITHTLITTSYFKDNQDLLHIAYDSKAISDKAQELGFPKTIITNSPNEALKIALNKKRAILATGSLYYLADIYSSLKKEENST